MSTIVTRAGKGSPLTNTEMDDNFSNLNTDKAEKGVAQSFTKAQRGAIVALTDGATITPDFSLANNYEVTLGGNRTLAEPTNSVEGQMGIIHLIQDGTGSRTLAYAWPFVWEGGTVGVLSTAAGSHDELAYYITKKASATFTVTIATPGVVSWTAHGLREGQKVRLTTTGALPTGLAIDTTYFVKYVDANSFQLSLTRGGAAINTTGTQSGTHTCNAHTIRLALATGLN